MMIQVEIKNSQQLLIVFPYSTKRLERVRLIDGRHWDAARRQWFVPFTEKAIGQIRAVFHDETISWGAGMK
jgi:integrase/recombinase XerD